MAITRLALSLAATCLMFTSTFAQQNSATADAQTFAAVVKQNFRQWDRNGDGVLSKAEIDAAVANPKVRGEAAAAIAMIRMVVHGNKYSLPPLTETYFASSALEESDGADAQDSLEDAPAKSEKIAYPPPFQPRFQRAVLRLSHASRDLFPQSLPSLDTIHQEGMGDCEFVSTVGAMVARNPATVKAMFTKNDNGSFTVTFGDGHIVKIERITDADICICATADANGLWLTVLEKAFRKNLLREQRAETKDKPDLYDPMANVNVIATLDGLQTRRIGLFKRRGESDFATTLRRDLSETLRKHRLVKAGTPEAKNLPPGITTGHAYAVLSFDSKTDLVHIWNPHNNSFLPKGPDGLQNGYTTKSGQFNIPLKEFLQVYASVTLESGKDWLTTKD